MREYRTLTRLRESGSLILAAHRGASWEHPENTVPAMEAAVAAGAEMIEFDVRASRDGVPVLLHDDTVDRTSDGSGRPEAHTLAGLRRLNFSWFRHGARLDAPCFPALAIPTLEEVIERFRGRACMNIQTYARTPDVLAEICRLYETHDLHDHAYLTVYPETADEIRRIAPGIELCLTPGWAERTTPENLRRCRDFGCRFVQPIREHCTPETFRLCRELGLTANVFFTDDPAVMGELAAAGAGGVMTNRPELLASERMRRGLLPPSA